MNNNSENNEIKVHHEDENEGKLEKKVQEQQKEQEKEEFIEQGGKLENENEINSSSKFDSKVSVRESEERQDEENKEESKGEEIQETEVDSGLFGDKFSKTNEESPIVTQESKSNEREQLSSRDFQEELKSSNPINEMGASIKLSKSDGRPEEKQKEENFKKEGILLSENVIANNNQLGTEIKIPEKNTKNNTINTNRTNVLENISLETSGFLKCNNPARIDVSDSTDNLGQKQEKENKTNEKAKLDSKGLPSGDKTNKPSPSGNLTLTENQPASENQVRPENQRGLENQAFPENPEFAKSMEISSVIINQAYPRNKVLVDFLKGSRFWFCSYFKKILFFTILYIISFAQTQKKHFITDCFIVTPTLSSPKTILLHTCVKCFNEKNYVSQNSLENLGYIDLEEMKKDKLLGFLFLFLMFFSFMAVIRAFSYTKIMSDLLTFGIRVNLATCPKLIVFLKSNSFIIMIWITYLSVYIYDYCYYEPERIVETCEDYGQVRIRFNDYTNFLLTIAGLTITLSAASLFFYTIYKFYYDYISVHFTNIYELMRKDKKIILKALHETEKEVTLAQFDEVFSYLVKKGRTKIFGSILYFIYCSREVETEDVVRQLNDREFIKPSLPVAN